MRPLSTAQLRYAALDVELLVELRDAMAAALEEAGKSEIARQEFADFARSAQAEGIRYIGGCCGCNAAYIRALAAGVASSGYAAGRAP